MTRPRVIAVIPARGGSKGLPGKNIRPLAGRPLIAWTIEAAARAGCIDHTVVSSDDDMILHTARRWGAATDRRPPHLATDTANVVDTVLRLLDQTTGYDYVALLQPTSPLRTATDIEAAFACCLEHEAPCCVSVTPAAKSPYWMYDLTDGRRLRPLLGEWNEDRRQDLPPAYVPNGAIYLASVPWLRRTHTFYTDETVAYVMPQERSVDIDTVLDFALAELLVTGMAGQGRPAATERQRPHAPGAARRGVTITFP